MVATTLPGGWEGFRLAFLSTPYAALTPSRVEAAFLIHTGGRVVRGRIDAVYEREGRTELVDWKTGSPPAPGDPSASTQLELCALAAVDQWRLEPSKLRTTYAYLHADGSHDLVSEDWDPPRVARSRTALARVAAGLDERRFDAHPGAWCNGCDYRLVCPAATTVAATS